MQRPSQAAAPPARAGFNLPVHGARGLFAMFVVAFHVANSDVPGFAWMAAGPARLFARSLEYGVELFFAISGFVILGALRRAPGPGAFVLDRALRIYPVLWASLVPMGLHAWLRGLREFGGLSAWAMLATLPANLLALPGVFPIPIWHPPAWSLSYEMLFYLACGLAWWLRPRLGPAATAALVAPAAAVLLVLFPRAIFFLSGLLAYEGLVARVPGAARLTRAPGAMLLAFLAAWAGVQALTPAPLHIVQTTLADWAGDARLPLAALAFAAATLAFQGIVEGRGALGRMLVSRPMLYLGTISYSLYLWHLPAMGVVRRAMIGAGLIEAAGPWAQAAFAAMALPLSLLAAHLSHRIIEVWLTGRLRALLRRPRIGAQAALGATEGRGAAAD